MTRTRPGDILLIACYELGHQPLSLASPLGLLAEAGYAPAALDLSVEPLSPSVVAQARFVAISVPMHTALRLGEQTAARVRQINPSAHVCFYGLYAWLNADYLLRGPADTVVAGEYEQPLLDLIQSLERGEAGPIAGVGTRARRAEPYLHRLRFILPKRDTLPPIARYAHFVSDGDHRLAGYVEASRGCLHTCLHCPITPVYNGRFFVVPAEIVLADIRAQVNAGARHITFGDPDFLNGPGHSLKIVRALHDEFPAVTFDLTAKVEHILEFRDLFLEFRALGCAFVVSAFESTSDLVLASLAKGHTRADMTEALQIVADAGIPLRPSWVAFTPWTSLDDYVEMLEFVRANDLIDHIDPVQYSIRLLVPPGSALAAQPDNAAWLGKLEPGNYAYRWDHPDPRMDALYHAVSERLERAAAAGEDGRTTFGAIRDLAYAATGTQPAADDQPPAANHWAVPHLTESWFC
ncbi:MAG: radical SAM protein [Chloroflexi bacterium]|nr:radical SAM protein [Chloroflexota bacterium]